ncbi:WD40 repeat-like protein [Gyrodon lividus]|nr:WD40 repeat-like protein [Gyrodon lividus]
MSESSPLVDTARKAYWLARGLPGPSVLHGHTGTIRSVAFLADGKQVISGSDDRSIRAWRVEGGEEVGKVMTEEGLVFAVAASNDGRWIATGGVEKNIAIWETTTHKKVAELKGHSHWVWSLAFSPDSARVVSGSRDETVIVWSTTTGKRLAGPLKEHTYGVASVSFSPSGNEIATCNLGHSIRIWNSHSSKLVIQPIKVDAFSLAWTPNGQHLIAGCKDGSIKIFDPSTGSLLARWNGHSTVVRSITVSPNGKFIASGSWDGTARLWDTTTRHQIGPALPHDDHVVSVAISPDGNHLVSGGRDQKVRTCSLGGIVPPSLLENTPSTSNNAPANASFHLSIPPAHTHPMQVHEANIDSQQVSDPLPHAQGSQSLKDNEDTVEKGTSEVQDTIFQRRPSESSSLRAFLDRPAVAPFGKTEDSSDPTYGADFFKSDSPAVRDILTTFTYILTYLYPQPATPPQELTEKDKGKQKASDPDPAPAEDTVYASFPVPTPKPKPVAFTSHTRRQGRNRVYRIRQALMRYRIGSTAQAQDPLERPPVAHGNLTKRHAPGSFLDRHDNQSSSCTNDPLTSDSLQPPFGHPRDRHQGRQEQVWIAEARTRPRPQQIFAIEVGPLPDEIERSCCFHVSSYICICYGQRDPNINPVGNDAHLTTGLISQLGHDLARTNSRFLKALRGLFVRLHIRKRPPVLPTSVQPILSSNGGYNGAPTSTSTSNQSPPAIMITPPMGTTEAPPLPTFSSQTPSPPPAHVDPIIEPGGAQSETEWDLWKHTDTERTDGAFAQFMSQLDLEDPWRDA